MQTALVTSRGLMTRAERVPKGAGALPTDRVLGEMAVGENKEFRTFGIDNRVFSFLENGFLDVCKSPNYHYGQKATPAFHFPGRPTGFLKPAVRPSALWNSCGPGAKREIGAKVSLGKVVAERERDRKDFQTPRGRN